MRTLLVTLCMLFVLGTAEAQETLGSDHFAPNASSILLFDLESQTRVVGSLHSNAPANAQMTYIGIPVEFSEITVSDAHVTALVQPSENLVVGYNRQPSNQSSTLLAEFRVRPGEQYTEFGDAFQFTPPSPGLYVIRNGLRTRVYYQNLATRRITYESMPPLVVASPDSVGFILPEGWEGRTIGGTGQMFSPSPAITSPVVSFMVDPATNGNYVVDFSRPEPGWFKDVTDFVLKLIAVFLPVPLLLYTKPEDVNEKRYKMVAGAIVLLILAAYGGLSVYAYMQGLGLKEIGENAVFALATIVVTFLTYWTTRAPSNQA